MIDGTSPTESESESESDRVDRTTNPIHQLRLENLKRWRRLQFKTTAQTTMTAPRVLSEVSKFYKEQALLETRIASGIEESHRSTCSKCGQIFLWCLCENARDSNLIAGDCRDR